MKTLFKFLPALSLLLIISSCGKEELQLNQANIDDLKYSYYKLADNTIELSEAESRELVISKTETQLVIKTSTLERRPIVGDIFASEWGINEDIFILRKITNIISENGDEATYETIPAKMIESYSEYYFSSKLEDVVRLRSTTLALISEGATGVTSTIINKLVADDFLPFEIEPTLELEGEVNWEAIHPNTAYTIFCNTINCAENPSEIDSDNDMIWDVTENLFGEINPKVKDNGLYTLEFTDFRVKSYGVKVAKSLDAVNFSAEPAEDILTRLKAETQIAKVIDKDLANNLGLVYIPTPLAYPPFSVTGVVSPFFDFTISGGPFFSVTGIPNQTATIQFGHINWRSTVPNFKTDFKVLDSENEELPLGELVLPADISYTLGLIGEINLDSGLGLGAAVTVGEGNKAGASIGGLLKLGVYKNISGELAVRVNDAVNNSIFDGDISGSACLDIGLIHEPVVFTDVNTPDGILGAIFDYQLSVPIPLAGHKTSLFAFASEPVGIDNKLCIGTGTICQSTVQVYANIAEDAFSGSGESLIEFKYSNSKITINDSYQLNVVLYGTEYTIGEFSYNEDYLNTPLSLTYSNIVGAIEQNEFMIKIVDVNTLCEIEYGSSKVGLIYDCSTPNSEINATAAIFENLNLELIEYYKFETLRPLIETSQLILPTEEELIALLNTNVCKNPVGVLIDNANLDPPYVKLNSHLSYYWVRDNLSQPIVLEATPTIVDGEAKWEGFRLRSASESSYACLLLN